MSLRGHREQWHVLAPGRGSRLKTFWQMVEDMEIVFSRHVQKMEKDMVEDMVDDMEFVKISLDVCKKSRQGAPEAANAYGTNRDLAIR